MLPYEVVVEVEHLDPEEDVPSIAFLLPAGEVIIETLDPVLEGLVQPLHEVLPSDEVDVVLHSKPSAGLGVPSPFVRPDWLPAIPGAEVPDEVVGIQDVPLIADPEAKELPVKGVEGDPDPCLLPSNAYHGLIYKDGMHGVPPHSEPARQKGEPVDPLAYRFIAPILERLKNP